MVLAFSRLLDLNRLANGKKIIIFGTDKRAIDLAKKLSLLDAHIGYFIGDITSYAIQQHIPIKNAEYIQTELLKDCFFIRLSDSRNEQVLIAERVLFKRCLQCNIDTNEFVINHYYTFTPWGFFGSPVAPDPNLFSNRVYTSRAGIEVFGNPIKQSSLRILTLGGSTTDPLAFSRCSSWSERLYKKIRTVGYPISLYCAGHVSYSSREEVVKFLRELKNIKPDIVLSFSGINDCHRNDNSHRVLSPVSYGQINIHAMSTIFQMLDSLISQTANKNRDVIFGNYYGGSRVAHFINNMRILYALSQQYHFQYISFLQPTRNTNFYFQEPLSRKSYNDFSASVLELSKDLPYMVDLTHIFKDIDDEEIFIDIAHVNARGNEIIAEHIYNELIARDILKKSYAGEFVND